MTIEKVSDILKEADHKGYAVPAFNVFNYESIAWLIEAAEEESSPVIAMLYPPTDHIYKSSFTALTKDLAAKVETPVGLHFDHSRSFSEIMEGIKAGFTSVMIDGSSLSFEDNIELTKQVVQVAHPLDIDVEAELGFVGSAGREEDFRNKDLYTDPDRAREFIERTEVDSLAVAVGSAHGNYVSEPDLDLNRLAKINEKVNVPLVLHGGSGIPEPQLKEAVQRGINKVNIGTELNQHFFKIVKKKAVNKKGQGSMLGCLGEAREEIKQYFKYKIRLLKNKQ